LFFYFYFFPVHYILAFCWQATLGPVFSFFEALPTLALTPTALRSPSRPSHRLLLLALLANSFCQPQIFSPFSFTFFLGSTTFIFYQKGPILFSFFSTYSSPLFPVEPTPCSFDPRRTDATALDLSQTTSSRLRALPSLKLGTLVAFALKSQCEPCNLLVLMNAICPGRMMPFDREERSFYSGLIVKKQLYRYVSIVKKQLYRWPGVFTA
jgi:hypothetical protein